MNPSSENLDSFTEVKSFFMPQRNALLTKASFTELYIDHYLHLSDLQLRPDSRHDQMLKEALAAITLHAASKPATQNIAWTLNFQEPLVNLFVTANNKNASIIGQIFTKNVKAAQENLFIAQNISGNQSPRQSTITFTSTSPLQAAETYYRQSEQRLARYFHLAEEELILISAQPDCDLDWLKKLTPSTIKHTLETEKLHPLETRPYRWFCGCSHLQMLKILSPSMITAPETLFGQDESLRISCPRCGTPYHITKEALQAHVTATRPPQ